MKIKLPQLKSREEFLAAVDEAVRVTVDLRSEEAARDRRIQQIQDEHSKLIEGQKAIITALVAQAEKFAREHQCELLLGKARSAETALARYGFRTGMPQLKLKAKMTWDKVIAVLVTEKREMWLRTKVEAAKDAIIAACQARAETAAIADRIGMRIVQEEAFYIEPKLDDATQVKPAK